MMNQFDIRPATLDDSGIIADFNSKMAMETENKLLDPESILLGVKNMIESPQKGYYIVAESGPKVIACLMVTKEWSDWRNKEFWWIQSVYVHPEFRQKGAFKTMYQTVRSKALSQKNVCGIRLYVERENMQAQKTYESLGMGETVYKMYEEEL